MNHSFILIKQIIMLEKVGTLLGISTLSSRDASAL